MLDERYPERISLEAFAIGSQVNKDEAIDKSHYELGYPEFALALAWVLYVRAGCRTGNVGRFAVGIQESLGAPLIALHRKVITWSGSPAPLAALEDKLQHWTVGAGWINKMW